MFLTAIVKIEIINSYSSTSLGSFGMTQGFKVNHRSASLVGPHLKFTTS